MDVRQLFDLAKDNSKIAVKKFERQSAKRGGIDSFNVSNTAVSKFLAKKQKQKEVILEEENRARQQRIKARLEANLNKKKPTVKSQQQVNAENLKKKYEEDKVKFKVDKGFKKPEGSKHNVSTNGRESDRKIKPSHENKHKRREEEIKKHGKESGSSHKSKSSHESKSSHKSRSSHESKHRKEIERTNLSKNIKKHKPSNKSAGSSVDFMSLMKMAKDNTQNALKKDDPHRINLKRPAIQEVKYNETKFDPDRNIKVKMNRKEEIRKSSNIRPSSNKEFNVRAEKLKIEKRKEKHIPPNKTTTTTNTQRPKCSLIAETISTKSQILPRSSAKIQQNYRPTKSNDQSSIAKGIAAQNVTSKKIKNGKSKNGGKNYEDEFDKEERDLMRRRKLFEMQRITGNRNMAEEDLFYDDEDEDEEDEEDDDFIDDSETTVNPSKYIREIFGYDKRRFADSDEEDLSNMEASYSQIEKEEQRSARIARIEDEYEAMKEEEAVQRQKKKKK